MKSSLLLNRPIHVGFTVLELSKVHMYNFHYNICLQTFPQTKLLFTDTDSLAYAVDNVDVYKKMATIKNEFDFSEYPKDHFLYNMDNMKEVGKFKDELKGKLMEKFVGLRPKLYSYIYTNEEIVVEKHTAKGVKQVVKNNILKFKDYEKCLKEFTSKSINMNYIRSDHHHLYSYSTQKVGLSMFDDKRWICNDGIHTLAHGHYKTL